MGKMSNCYLNTSNVRKSMFIFVCFMLLKLTVTQSPDSKQNVNNNIPEPTVIQIQPQKTNFTSEVTLPIIIQPPSLIYPVYYSRFKFEMHQNCMAKDYGYEKKIGDYIKFKKGQLGKFQGWNVEIIDGAYNSQKQILYALLTNGSLIKAFMNKTIQKQNKISKFEMINYQKNQTQQIWQLDKYDMYLSKGSLYLLRNKELFVVRFLEEKIWTMQAVKNGKNVVSVQYHQNNLYIVKSKGIHVIDNGQVSANSLISSTSQQDTNRNFVDVSIDGQFMYLLCRIEGIYLIDMQNNFQVIEKYNYQFHQQAYEITARNNTVLINFKLFRKIYIGEFFFIQSDIKSYAPAFRLNKFYYRFDEMNKVVMFNDFALVYSLTEMNIFQHSINRKSPFEEIQTEQLYRASFPKILDVIQLDDERIHYILIEKNGIFVERFGSESNGTNTLFNTYLECSFDEAGTYEFNVSYVGTCKDHKSSTEAYCTKLSTYKFEITNQIATRQVQAFNSHLFLFLILILILVFVLGGVLAYRRYTLDRQQRLFAILSKKQQNNSKQLKEKEQSAN